MQRASFFASLAKVFGAASLLTALPPCSTASAATIKFQVFNGNGIQLTYDTVIDRMSGRAGASFMSSGTMELATLKAVALNGHYNSGGLFAIDVPSTSKQGIMVHWNTPNTGYSSFLLDNGGQAFTQDQTLVFNEQLAKDAYRQFIDAYNRRMNATPAFITGAQFDGLKKSGDDCMARLAQPAAAPIKGAIGQECLDYIVQAMALMLKRYGKQTARTLETAQTYGVWGVSTYPTSAAYKTNIDELVPLFEARHRWARLVMDDTSDSYFSTVDTVLGYAAANQVQTLGQLFDSSIQSGLSLNTYKAAVDRALARPGFSKFTAWEVGNEVNGGWLGSGMSAKIDYAAAQVKAKTGKKVFLTFYWYGIEDTLTTSLFNWIDANITQSIRNNIDVVALSIYVDQQPLGFSRELVMTKLADLFPGKMIAVGELGFVDPTVKMVFRESPMTASDDAGAQLYINTNYPASFGTKAAMGGNFWWYYDTQMVGKTSLWNALHTIYCNTYIGFADVSNACK